MMKTKRNKQVMFLPANWLSVVSLVGLPAIAMAADNEAGGEVGVLEEITVTATRFATSAQDVPLAISAISGESLMEAGITDPRQLSSLAPGLVVDQGNGTGQTHASIRGLASTDFGLGAQSPVAIYLDDVYQPFEYGLGTQVFDLDRIEVLRGPQSTLFGKNTTGGGIAYYSKAPVNSDEGYFSLDAGGGTYNHVAGEGAINKAFTDSFAARLSFRVAANDKFVTNLSTGKKRGDNQNYNGRLQFAWNPSDATHLNLKLYALNSVGDSPAYVGRFHDDPLFGNACGSATYGAYFCSGGTSVTAPESIDSRHVYGVAPTTYQDFNNRGATLKLEQLFGEYKLTSITNFQTGKYRVGNDDTGVGSDAFHSRLNSKTRQVSQELRLATPAAQPLRAVIGAFGMYDKIEVGSGFASTDPNVFPYVIASKGEQETTSWAAFSAVTYDITSQFGVVGGVRYSSEHKKIDDAVLGRFGVLATENMIDHYDEAIAAYPTPGLFDFGEVDAASKTWSKLTWELTANYKPVEDQLLYTKVATGFRTGGFPIGITAVGTFKPFEPEKVTSYEIGYKSEWLNRRLRFNADVYFADYKDMQVQVQAPDSPTTLIRENAAAARLKGIELELEAAITTALRTKISAGYSDAKYRDYATPGFVEQGGKAVPADINLKGKTLPYAPKYTGSFDLSYDIPIGANNLSVGTTWNYRSKIYFDPANFDVNYDPSRVTGDIRATYEWDNRTWSLSAYVENVTNRYIKGFGYVLSDASPNLSGNPSAPFNFLDAAAYNPGRLWGLRLSWKY